ncbi:MAG: dTDP-4-dehydrorhamnose reductase [Nitrospirales bacterium]
MKVLVIGAHGQLGHALREVLSQQDVLAWDIEDLDITKRGQTLKAITSAHPDIVINAAAYTNVDQAESDSSAAYRVNAVGPQNLALATEGIGVPLVHISTDYVFDGSKAEPYHEFDQPHPSSIYGKSKLAGEAAVRAFTRQYFIVRTAWLYHTVGKNFPKTICQLAKQSDVRVVSDQQGSPTFAPHLAKAIEQLIMTKNFGTYHLAGAGGTSWFELTQTLFHHLGIKAHVTPVSTKEFPLPAPRPMNSVLTTLQDPAILLPPWEEGVREFVDQSSQVM